MKKISTLLVALFFSVMSFAQVGIGTIAPVAGSLLELKATDKALLISRIGGASAAITSPVDGMIIYDNSVNCFRSRENGAWSACWNCCAMVSTTVGTVSTLNCAGIVNWGTLTHAVAASAVSSDFPYTGGNSGTYTGQVVTSTGVTGLTATLLAGNLATGAGTVTYVITGTPASTGTASFAINVAGKTCTLALTVL
jgi:hypothetical protein